VVAVDGNTEISLREIETQMLEPGGGLRSKSPELLPQELRGPAAGPFRHPIAAGRGCRLGEPGSGSAVVHAKYQPRPPPGHRPGGISPGRLERARDAAIAEILERVSKGRHKRTYPRVIKKYKGRTFRSTARSDRPAARLAPEIRRPLVALLN
jgi:hypothetical protein